MSTRRTQATMINDVKQATETYKQLTSTSKPEIFAPGSINSKFKLAPALTVALANLGWLAIGVPDDAQRGGRKAKDLMTIQWAAGDKEISSKELTKIYNTYTSIETKRKQAIRARAQGIMPKPKVKPNIYNQIKVKQPAGVTSPTKSTQVAYSKPESPFKGKGTIFGYKQLKFIKEMYRDKDTTIMIDDKFIFENVKIIKFIVDGSRVTVEMYMYADKEHNPDITSKVGSFALDNIVLGFSERGEDSKVTSLAIYTVPVKDPYSIND